MRVLIQRAASGKVVVDDKTVGEIEQGLVLLVGFGKDDTEAVLKPMAQKVTNLRIFPDEKGRFDRSVKDIGGAILVVPQFTLYGDTNKGRRPDFFGALEPEKAEPLVGRFVSVLQQEGIGSVEQGEFGAHMMVTLTNDGPVTLMLEM
jgi:D-tyrosyl-tRNA(Tyr) deacylase